MQFGVNIGTNENDLKINYGLINFGEERLLARASVKYIFTDLNDIRVNYIRLGFHLSEFENMEYYKDFRFSTFTEFIEANIPLDKSAVSRCINVFREFCHKEYDCCGCLKKRFNHLSDDYKEFSYSQLCEMLPMSEDARKKITPDMSIKQIREVKKDKNVSRENKNVSQVATSQQDLKIDKPKKDLSKVSYLKGASLQCFVKSLKNEDLEACESVTVCLFDSNGKPVPPAFNVSGLKIYNDNGTIYIRLNCQIEKEGVENE